MRVALVRIGEVDSQGCWALHGPHHLQPDLVESIEDAEAETFDRLRQ
jgi:hypothetical protein